MTQSKLIVPFYKFNIRSFHPEKTFGWSGLYFEGDNRGFSLKPNSKVVTSRIWHQFLYNPSNGKIDKPLVGSDDSKATWQDETTKYDTLELKPKRSQLQYRPPSYKNKRTIINTYLMGKYWGSNHAMPFSKEMQEHLGFTYVPDIDVEYRLITTLDTVNHHLDIALHIRGDRFPNTEAFVVDPSGQAVFLGTHVRWGAAPTTLMANFRRSTVSAVIRLPLKSDGNFAGTVEDERGRKLHKMSTRPSYNFTEWNQRFIGRDPNAGHCMGLEDLKRLKECM